MSDPTYATLVLEQLAVLRRLIQAQAVRAMQGEPRAVETLFATQQQLERWLPYLASEETRGLPGDAPEPFTFSQPAPPLPHEQVAYDAFQMLHDPRTPAPPLATEAEDFPTRVSFPPGPLWTEQAEEPPYDER